MEIRSRLRSCKGDGKDLVYKRPSEARERVILQEKGSGQQCQMHRS